jgi:hypothetical protein
MSLKQNELTNTNLLKLEIQHRYLVNDLSPSKVSLLQLQVHCNWGVSDLLVILRCQKIHHVLQHRIVRSGKLTLMGPCCADLLQ